MKKLILVLLLTMLAVMVVAGPALAEGGGVSATGFGRCDLNPNHDPGSGAASHIWVPEAAYGNANGGNSGLHFMTAP